MLRSKKGKEVEVKRGKHEGLTGTVVGKTYRGTPKVKLDDATHKGNSVVKVKKGKLKKK